MNNDILVKIFVALIFAMTSVLYKSDPSGTQSYREASKRYSKN